MSENDPRNCRGHTGWFFWPARQHQRQTRQNGEMPRIAPMLPRVVLDIGIVGDRVFKSRLHREYDLGNARRKVASLRGTTRLHQDRLPLRRPPHLHRPGGGVVTAGIVHGMDVVDVGPHAGVDVADQGAVVPAIPQGANGRGKVRRLS